MHGLDGLSGGKSALCLGPLLILDTHRPSDRH
jgi:hypothetical protein